MDTALARRVTKASSRQCLSGDHAAQGRILQPKVAQGRVIVRPSPDRPIIFAVTLADWSVVDAGDAATHQTAFVELPELVAVVVVPFIGEANGDAVLAEIHSSLIRR
jgi:hypothetical protein